MDRIEQLAKQLNETRASKRIAAVRELAKIGGERVVPHLIGRLSDAGKSGDVRVCDIAAEGLEKIGSPEALVAALHWREDPFPFFEKALKSYDPFLEIAAVREISKMDGQRVIDALLYATASYSYRVSRAARGIIEGKGTEAVSYLVNYLNGKNNFRRGYAAVLLGRIGDPVAVPDLMNALEDENANLRMDSAWALGLIGDARAVDALRKRLADIERPNDLGNLRVCDHAAAALRDIKTDEARALTAQWQADPIPFFVEGLTSERTKNRHRLAFFLGSFQDERIVSALITALDDDDAEVQRGSAWSLGHMGDKRAIPHLLEKLGSADALPRSAMIQALGRLKADEAVTHLVKQLDDESPYYLNQRICDAAAEALLRIGTPEAIASVDAWNQTRP